MSDLGVELERLGKRAGAAAAVILESSGIEVAGWGEGEFETTAAELADLWRQVRSSELGGGLGGLRGVAVEGEAGAWAALPLGEEYVLALLAPPGAPLGRVRFYAGEWARENEGDFA